MKINKKSKVITSKKNQLKQAKQFSMRQFGILGAIFAVFGLATIGYSFAASPVVTVKADALFYSTTAVTKDGTGTATLTSTGYGTANITLPTETNRIKVVAKSTKCDGDPQMVVKIDDKKVLSEPVNTEKSYKTYEASINVAAGSHILALSFINGYSHDGKCNRTITIDKIDFYGKLTPVSSTSPNPTLPANPTPVNPPVATTPTPTPPSVPVNTTPLPNPGNPLAGANFYVNPEAARLGRPAAIATRPVSKWFGSWSGDPRTAMNAYVTPAANAGQVPIATLYNIPNRDCGQYSAGGLDSAAAYRTWIDGIVAGLGNRRAVIVLEPDAVPLVECLSDAGKTERFGLLSYAVNAFKTKTQANVYIDAGNSSWKSVDYTVDALRKTGIAQADGFSLNVSNFYTTDATSVFGDKVSKALGKGYVIDTSRNGKGSNGQWCNPSGRGLGKVPTTNTGNQLVHAYLWIKAPGESDGQCNNGPAAGQWWQAGAEELIRNAVY